MSLRKAIKLAAVALAVHSSAMAVGDVIFDGGAPNIENGQPITNWEMAEDFELGFSAVINGATVPVIDLFGHSLSGWDGTLQWALYEAVPGQAPDVTKPGPLIVGGAGTNIGTELRYTNGSGWQFYTFSFDFGQDVFVDANTHYWFGLHLNQGYTQQYLYWQQTSAALFDHMNGRANGQGQWSYQGSRNGFTLVPEPGSAGLLLLAAATLLRRRVGR